jgi:hypothetical protein
MVLPDAVAALAARQSGVLGVAQLRAAGVSRETIRWRSGRHWRMLLPGVLALQTGLPSEEQRLVAALVLAGEGSWLAGSTAAALHGIRGARLTAPVRVLVPAPRRARTVAWVQVTSTTVADEPVIERGPLRLSCPPRAVIDAAAATADDRSARGIVLDAVQRRLVRLDDLEHWLDLRGRPGSARLRRFLAEAAAGSWSVPESDVLALVRGSAVLPEPWVNPLVTGQSGQVLTSPDLWFDDVAMALMVQSRQFHAGVLDWDETVASASDLSAMRVVVVGVTPSALSRDPRHELHRIESAYLTARSSGVRAPVRATPRAVPGALHPAGL